MAVKIATRGSQLAQWQADFVAQHLKEKYGTNSEKILIKTRGDIDLTTPLSQLGGGKGIFVKELETALLAREADIAVHSLKDMSASVTSPFALIGILKRHSPFDVIVFSERHRNRVQSLPNKIDDTELRKWGSLLIGTGSARRTALLKDIPEVQCVSLRGNVQTRLRKLEDEQLDAVIMAEAALDRLNLKDSYLVRTLDPQWFVPCAAQGAIAVEALEERAQELTIERIVCNTTTHLVNIERKVLEKLGGSCNLPAGVYASLEGEQICARLFLDLDGKRIRKVMMFPRQVDINEAADRLLS